MGALAAEASKLRVEIMQRIGHDMGIAFQLKDDLIDYSMTDVGKPIGMDFKEGNMTLPLILALRNAPPQLQKKVLYNFGRNSNCKTDFADIALFVKHYGGVDGTKSIMKKYQNKALKKIKNIPQSIYQESLILLINSIKLGFK